MRTRAGFSFSTTSTFALASRGYRIEFVPIRVERRVGKSTVSVATGFQTILLVLRLASLFNPLRVFLPLSFFFIIGGMLYFNGPDTNTEIAQAPPAAIERTTPAPAPATPATPAAPAATPAPATTTPAAPATPR